MSNTPHHHVADVDDLLRQHGVHCTRPRKLVWQFFAGQQRGCTIAEAAAALATHGVGQATVYRTVLLLQRLGLLTSVHDEVGKVRYSAMCPGHRHALVCRGCQTVVEFADCELSLLEKLLSARTGFAIQGHHLEVYGTCPACAGVEACA
jgi:Fe2+ or Zn2+ uptake regulation protein